MKKALAYIFIIIIVISSIIYLQDKPILDQRHYRCVELLNNGELYEGQPFCEQGPVLYITLSLLQLIALNYKSLMLLHILLNVCVFVMIWSIARREVRHLDLSVLLLFYLPIIGVTSFGKPEMLLCTLFFLIGFLQFYYEGKHWSSGFWFALSMLSKFSVAPIIAFTMLFFVLIRHIHKVPKSLMVEWKEVFKSLKISLKPLITIIIVFFIVWLWKPNVFKYSVISHMGGTEQIPFGYAVVTLTNVLNQPNLSHLLIYFIILFFGFMLFKDKNVHYFLSSAGFATILYLFVKGASNLGGLNFVIPKAVYYMIPVYAVWIIAMLKSISSKYSRIAWIFTIMIVFLPGYFVVPAIENAVSHTKEDVEKQVLVDYARNFLEYIPRQHHVLMDGPSSYKKYKVNSDKIDFIDDQVQYEEGVQIDPAYGPSLIELLGDDYKSWERDHMLHQTFTEKAVNYLFNREYSMVIVSPPSLLSVEKVISKVPGAITDYCNVSIPEFSYTEMRGRHHATLYFLNHSDCNTTLQLLDEYYNQDAIISMSFRTPFFANITNNLLVDQGLESRVIISEGSDIILKQNNVEKNFYNSAFIMMILLVIITMHKYKRGLDKAGT